MVLSLRILLPCLAVCLVASGAVAIGVAGVSAARGYLMRETDGALRACAASVLSQGLMTLPSPGPAPDRAMSGACGIQLRSAAGQVLIPAAPAVRGPDIPVASSWLSAHLARPFTVPGPGGGSWRAVIVAVRYQPQRMWYVYGPDDLRYVIGGPAAPGSSGPGLAAARYAAAAGAVLVLLAAAAFALTRAILHASCAAEAAARRSAADMSRQLGQTCLQLRRPASILYGFSEYCRSQDGLPPAGLDQMMQRLAGEITRMETLADGLRVRSASEPGRREHQPDPPAAGPVRGSRPIRHSP